MLFMDDKQLLTLQKLVIEYFKETSNETFVNIVDSLVYNQPNNNQKASKLIEKFLKDNGLEVAFINYMSDFRDQDNKIFRRSSPSQITIIEGIKMALLNASFNRLRQGVDGAAMNKRIKTEHAEMKRLISTLMDAGTNERYHDTLDEMRDLALTWKR